MYSNKVHQGKGLKSKRNTKSIEDISAMHISACVSSCFEFPTTTTTME